MLLKELEYKLDNYYNHRGLKDAINRLNTLKAEFAALYDSSGSIKYDGMPHGTMPGNAPLDAVCQLEDKPEQWKREISDRRKEIFELHHIDEAIENALQTLKPLEEEMIHLKHCEQMNFKQIAKATHYSESWAKHRYFSALSKILHIVDNKKDSTKKH